MADCVRCRARLVAPKCGLCGYLNPVSAPAPAAAPAPPGPAPSTSAPPLAPAASAAFAPAPTPSAPPIATPRAPVATPPASVGRPSTLVGSVRRMHSLRDVEPAANLWKWMTVSALLLGLLPVGIALFAVLVGTWIAVALLRWTLGFRGGGGSGTSLFDLLVLRRLGGGGGQAADRVPVHVYELDAGAAGAVHVRQTGDFAVGAIALGDEVELELEWRRGEAQLIRGFNRATRTPLRLPTNGWRPAFFVVAVALGVLWLGVLPSLQHWAPLR